MLQDPYGNCQMTHNFQIIIHEDVLKNEFAAMIKLKWMKQKQSININQIRRNLFKIPSERLREVSRFVEKIVKETTSVRRVERLEGIWKDIGFENISDLDKNIREIRGFSERMLSGRADRRWNT